MDPLVLLGGTLGGLVVVVVFALFVARFMKVGAGPEIGPCPEGVEDCDSCRFQATLR